MRESGELIFGLQVAHAAAAGSVQIDFFAHADAENGHVGFLQPLKDLIESVLAEGVEAGGQHENGFLALHVAQLVNGFDKRRRKDSLR